mgnify:FL=1
MNLCWGTGRPTTHYFFTIKLLWISLNFCQPNAITLQSMDRDTCQLYINSLCLNKLIIRLFILCYEIATQDAKSWICECHQPIISLRTFWQIRTPGLMSSWREIKKKNTAETIEEGGEGWGLSFYFLFKKICDEVAFYFIRDFLAPHFLLVFYFDDLFEWYRRSSRPIN